MDKINSIEIKELNLEHVPLLVEKLSSENPEYLKHFTAFELSVESFISILTKAVNDKYFGIYYGDEIVGFYMLRGFDKGFEIPSYGVWISSEYANNGLSRLTLYHAFSFCKLNKISTLMLKVHPDNKYAKKLYESLGFSKIGFDEKNGNYIYHKILTG